MTFAIDPTITVAQLNASVTNIDAAVGNSGLWFYATPQPPYGDPPGAVELFVIVLSKPCATVALGAMTLNALVPTGTMVVTGGRPLWARWLRGDGTLVADGKVTHEDYAVSHGGDFTLAGMPAPDLPDTSPLLLAGGIVLLGTVTLTG